MVTKERGTSKGQVAKQSRNGSRGITNGEFFELRLYVAGQTPKSVTALANLQKICHQHLEGRFDLHVIDLVQTPQLAQGDQILAIPTLVRNLPQPIRKIIGDLSDVERVLVGLDVRKNVGSK
jgi:circadian clock protein KaiB